MIIATIVLSFLYTVSAMICAIQGNITLTILFCAMMICEEVSYTRQTLKQQMEDNTHA